MSALFVILSAAVAALILSIKTFISTEYPDLAANQNLPIFYLVISLVASIAGALAFTAANPTLFANDPIFANAPTLGAVVAGVISVLPGGIGSSILTLLYLRNTPAAQTASKPKQFALWQ